MMRKYFYAFCFTALACGNVQAQTACSGTPETGVPVAEDSLVCAGDSVSVRLDGLTTTGLMFQWQRSPDGTTWTGIGGAIDSVYTDTITHDAWFRCVVTCVSSGESVESAAVFVAVSDAVPSGGSISHTNTGNTYFFSVSGISGSYGAAWDFGDGNTGTGTNPVHTYAASGNYDVVLVITNGCGTDTVTAPVSVATGMTENLLPAGSLILYPNPASEGFRLASALFTHADHVSVTDLAGRVSWTVSDAALPLYIPVTQFRPGLYIVSIVSSGAGAYLHVQVE